MRSKLPECIVMDRSLNCAHATTGILIRKICRDFGPLPCFESHKPKGQHGVPQPAVLVASISKTWKAIAVNPDPTGWPRSGNRKTSSERYS